MARRRSRIAHFKQPFIVGMAGSALALSCGGETGTGNAVTNPPPPTGGSSPTWGGGAGGSHSTKGGSGGLSYTNPPFVAGSGASAGSGATAGTGASAGSGASAGNGGSPGVGGVISNPPCFLGCAGTAGSPGEGGEGGAILVWTDCPESSPEPGSDCTVDQLFCRYPGCGGPEANTALCNYGQWVVEYSSGPACNPPPVVPVCPSALPEHEAGCAYEGQECRYGPDTCDSESSWKAQCVNGRWTVEETCPTAEGDD